MLIKSPEKNEKRNQHRHKQPPKLRREKNKKKLDQNYTSAGANFLGSKCRPTS